MFRIGDKCEILARKHGHNFKIGEVVEIISVDRNRSAGDCGSYRARSLVDDGEKWWLCSDEIELEVSEEEVADAIASIKKAQQ